MRRAAAAKAPAAESGEDIRRELEELTELYRFRYFALATVPSDGGRLFTDDVLFSSWPAELIHQFDELNLAGGIIDYVMHSTMPLQLDLGEFAKVVPPEIAEQTQQLLGSYGISRSVIFPVHNKDGSKAKVTFEGNRDFVTTRSRSWRSNPNESPTRRSSKTSGSNWRRSPTPAMQRSRLPPN